MNNSKQKNSNGIPEEWQSLPLSQCIDLVIDYRGKTPKKLGGDWNGTGYRALSAKNIKTGRLVEDTSIRHIGEDLYKLWMKNEIHRGDILLTSEGPLGESMYWDSDEKIVLSQRLFAIRTNSNMLDSKYFYQFTRTGHYQEELASRATGTTVSGIRQTELLKTRVILPSLPEQRAIAKILSDLDAKIDLNHRMNETLEQMARAIFKRWFVDFEFPGHEKTKFVNGLPEGWMERCVEDIAEKVGMGPFGSSIKVSTFVLNGIPIISGQHLNETMLTDNEYNFITEGHAEKLKSANVKRGDIVLTHAGNIGQVSYIPDGSQYEKYVISQRQFYLRPNLSKVSPLYLVYFFRSMNGQHQILANASSTGVPSISRPVTNLRMVKLILPSKSIVDTFDERIRIVHKQISTNIKQINILSKIRDTLLPKLMSGELRVN